MSVDRKSCVNFSPPSMYLKLRFSIVQANELIASLADASGEEGEGVQGHLVPCRKATAA